MRRLFATLILSLTVAAPALAQERVGEVSTTFRVVGPNDKVVIDRFDDPKVENASCYVSRAETGGLSGWVGLAEDPSRFSIACRATGPVKIVGEIERGKKGEVVFSEDTSILFKEMRVSRFFDAEQECAGLPGVVDQADRRLALQQRHGNSDHPVTRAHRCGSVQAPLPATRLDAGVMEPGEPIAHLAHRGRQCGTSGAVLVGLQAGNRRSRAEHASFRQAWVTRTPPGAPLPSRSRK